MFNKSFIISFIAIIVISLYVFFNPSYQKSLQAKYYFEMGDYTESLVLAKEAFSINVYNRMASTIMAQSIISLEYTKYNKTAEKYMQTMNKIATHTIISNSDKAKMRIICEIMISSYIKLSPSVITDKELVKQSANYYQKFEKLLEKVTK